MKRLLGIGALLAGLFCYVSAATAQNEQEVTFGNYVVNFNTFPSMFLDQSIAKAAGVKRSEEQGVITLAVRKQVAGSSDMPVKAAVTATTMNLIGQFSRVKLTQVIEGGAIYYIGDYPTTLDETITFTVTVQPDSETQKHEFKFARRF